MARTHSGSPVLSRGFLNDYVASGLVWSGDSYGGTLAASMTAGSVYLGGRIVRVPAVTARSFTASKDVYVDVNPDGSLTYTDNTLNAASPSLAAGSIRIAIIITGATNILNVGSVNQGQPTKLLPIASSVKYCVADSLGNRIYQTSPIGGLLSYRFTTVTYTSTSTTNGVDITALTTMPFIIPAGPSRTVKATFFANYVSHTVAVSNNHIYLREGSTILNTQIGQPAGASYIVSGIHAIYIANLAPGSYDWKASHYMQTAGTITVGNFFGGYPNFISVEYI